MKKTFKARVRRLKPNKVFRLEIGQISSKELAEFAGKEVTVTVEY